MEAELVGVNDAMYLIIWTRLFLEGQGFKVIDNVVHQDNQSAMLLARNSKMSSGKNTQHIKIRYYFVTDHIARGKVSLAYCPTDAMVADYFTKPLQGTKFRRFRAIIMNHRDWALELVSQECVAASPVNANQEEKDWQDPGLGNNVMVTPARVQLGPGGENAKELPDKANFTGESKECAGNSRRPRNDVANKGYTRHQA